MAKQNENSRAICQIVRDYEELELPIKKGTVMEEVRMIPMQDGIRLKTHIFHMEADILEEGHESHSVILQRTPYLQAEPIYRTHAEQLVKRGFVYVYQWCRGIGESEGEWNPNENERSDGFDTVHYLASCEWVKNIGFWGDSYLALTGWCMADAVPDKVKGMYLGVYGTDRFLSMYQKGLFRQDVFTSWAMENAGKTVTADFIQSYCFRPHNQADAELWGVKLPWYQKWISNVKEEDSYWQEGFWGLLREIPKRVKIPIFIREGWYDHHLGSAIRTFELLNEEAKRHSVLQIGCWNHGYENAIKWGEQKQWKRSEVKTMAEWFATVLLCEELPEPELDLYVIGADSWLKKDRWPLEIARTEKLYLAAGYKLVLKDAEAAAYEYEYDPDNPVPSRGTESMLHSMDKVGSMYQPQPGERKDVITFLSEPMEEDFIIGGKIRVYLTVSSDCADTAFTAKLMEEKETGKFVNIRSSITTIAADCKEGGYHAGEKIRVCIEMWDIVWKVSKGDRVRLDISSSDFPQYAVHTNFPGIWSEQSKCCIAHQTIFAGKKQSWVELPLIE